MYGSLWSSCGKETEQIWFASWILSRLLTAGHMCTCLEVLIILWDLCWAFGDQKAALGGNKSTLFCEDCQNSVAEHPNARDWEKGLINNEALYISLPFVRDTQRERTHEYQNPTETLDHDRAPFLFKRKKKVTAMRLGCLDKLSWINLDNVATLN